MLKESGKELSFAGSELTADSSLPIYDHLLLRPKVRASAGRTLGSPSYARTMEASL